MFYSIFNRVSKLQSAHASVEVVICGKYNNLNKFTKINISPWNFTDFLYLLFSRVYNAK